MMRDLPGATITAPREALSGRGTLLLAGIVLVGVLVRLPLLGNSLFGDELNSYYIVTHHSLAGIPRFLDGHSVDMNPPLYFMLSSIVERLGDSVLALRAVPMLAGTLTIAMTCLLGLRTVGKRAALTAAALMALSPYLIFYSTEARAYALVTALELGSTLCLLTALDGRGRGLRWWFGYALLACAAMYTHYTSVFVLAVQFAWAFALRPKRRRELLAATAGAAVGFLPWLPALIKNSHSLGAKAFSVLEPFSASAVARDVAHWSVGYPYLQLEAVPGPLSLIAIAAAVAIAVVAGVGRFGRSRNFKPATALRSPALLPVLLGLTTPVGLVVYSIAREDTWDMRNLNSSWPGLALTLGALLTCSRQVRVVAATVTLALCGFGLGAVRLLSPANQRPDYLQAARLVIREGDAHDPVAIIPAPTPGPLAAMDAAFAYAGDPGRNLLRVGTATLQATLAAPPYTFLPATPPGVLAAEAGRVRPGGKLFVIAPGTAPLATLLRTGAVDPLAVLGPYFGHGWSGKLYATVFVPLSQFLRAVRPAFTPVGTRVLPGILKLSVYELRRR